ncbi:Oidioi.mRNA.OKI2018_I69.chr2.g8224.t1.cds [Oikopleura dioica]|uniref:Cysteine--tRNA ligase, cytoplasmic n=1 Tax=Oikopleura dioica TaxID=34765 RepID=A0ABN7T8K8_OIKDI|nr:Oidioi.mRNA.OKI2018_I69.chr2.g8224.t1.cds [Oikopleura dioica]
MEKIARERWQWTMPEDNTPKLKVNNSLTRNKDEFRPANGKTVKWYSCGPTVYDHSHMGHARSYVSFDIIRRILRDYFGYDVFYQINITDIDDKIIKRARQQHLFQNWKNSSPSKDEVIEHANKGIERFQAKFEEETDPDKKTMYNNHLTAARNSVENFESIEKVLDTCVDSISDYLDKQLGSSVTDNSIFDALPRFWEKKYFEDMQALNIEDPDCLTRVSEYVPEIVDFVQKIIDQGYAYESNGSVYFMVDHYNNSSNHYYAKLVPEAVGNKDAIAAGLAEGEGSLAASGSEKRSESDFALWKNSKPGEPSWDSPWGKGRPGWHIECSVMASDIMGKTMDIHSGGVDLKFPHHDNELAQSEACWGNDNWVQYFLHTGHLTIAGCKMSKSLKNFITIKDALKKNSARQIRLSFLLHAWDKTLDYSDNTLADAVQYEKSISEFFANIKAALLNDDGILKKWGAPEKELFADFQAAQNDVHAKLCDNLNTHGACMALRDIVSSTNKYLAKQENPDFKLLRNVGAYVTKILKCFGCMNSDERIGFPAEGQAQNQNMDQLVAPYLQCLAQFRQEIRNTTRGDNSDLSKKLMQMCDDLRDMKLVDLGVRLEDKMDETGKPIIKLGNREQLLADRAAKEEEKRKKEEQKRAQAEKKPEKKLKRTRSQHLKLYTQWNDAGLPTHRKNPESGEEEEIPKSALKKLTKELNAQKSKHDKWLKKQQS